jgi:hypothetical protein
MNQGVARRRPAQVLSARPIRPAQVRRAGDIVAATRDEVLGRLANLQRQGRIESANPIRLITHGPHAGEYAIRVVLLPGRPSRRQGMRTRTKVAIAAAALAVVVTPIAYAVLTLSPIGLSVACCALVFGLALLASRGRRRTSVTVTTRVEVR